MLRRSEASVTPSAELGRPTTRGLSIGARVWLGFGVMIAILAAFSGVAVVAMLDGKNRFERFGHVGEVTQAVMKIDRDFVFLRRNILAYNERNDHKALAVARTTADRLTGEIAAADALIVNPDRRPRIEEIRAVFAAYGADFAHAVELKSKLEAVQTGTLDALDAAMRGHLVEIAERTLATRAFAGAAYANLALQHLAHLRLHGALFLDRNEAAAEAAGAEMGKDLAEIRDALDALNGQVTELPLRTRLANVLALVQRYMAAYDDVYRWRTELIALTEKTMPEKAARIAAAVAAIVASATQDGAETRAQTITDLDTSLAISTGLAIAGVMVALLLAWVISRGVAVPVARITAALDRFGAGDAATPIPDQPRGDEVGTIARAVEQVRLRIVRAAEHRATVIAGIERSLAALAEGDLRHRMDVPLPGDFERLRLAINRTFDGLNEAMLELGEAVRGLGTGLGHVEQTVRGLDARTRLQAATVEATEGASEHLAATLSTAQDAAARADRLTAATSRTAEGGSRLAADTVAALARADAAAHELGALIDAVDAIAGETHMVAVVAGVEAARAGEGGSGFAAVAGEMRALGERCREATRRIKAAAALVSAHVDDGRRLAGAGAETLAQLGGDLGEIAELVQETALHGREQAAGFAETAAALAALRQSTRQNGVVLGEAAIAVGALAARATQLATLAGQFHPDPSRRPATAPPGALADPGTATPAALPAGPGPSLVGGTAVDAGDDTVVPTKRAAGGV